MKNSYKFTKFYSIEAEQLIKLEMKILSLVEASHQLQE